MKYRKQNRKRDFDYSSSNLYFVTICVEGRECCFGDVHAMEMQLNAYGEIIANQWFWLSKNFSYIKVHAFVVMPNHVHGIIEIDRQLADDGATIKSLSEIIGAFKMTSSKQIHLLGFQDFSWQRSFHDHIIKDEKTYHAISKYIELNPKKWSGL